MCHTRRTADAQSLHGAAPEPKKVLSGITGRRRGSMLLLLRLPDLGTLETVAP